MLTLLLVVIVLLVLFGGGIPYSRYRGTATGYGVPDLAGLFVFCLLVYLVLRLLGVL